jgi:hypothetical protein
LHTVLFRPAAYGQVEPVIYEAYAVPANNGVEPSEEAHEPCQDVIRGLGRLENGVVPRMPRATLLLLWS